MSNAANLTKFEQFKELLKQLPLDITKISESLEGEQLDQIIKYVNDPLEKSISGYVEEIDTYGSFTMFGKQVEDLQQMKEAAVANTVCYQHPEPGTLSTTESHNFQLIRSNLKLKKLNAKNNTEIKLLMNEIEKQRNHVIKVSSLLKNL